MSGTTKFIPTLTAVSHVALPRTITSAWCSEVPATAIPENYNSVSPTMQGTSKLAERCSQLAQEMPDRTSSTSGTADARRFFSALFSILALPLAVPIVARSSSACVLRHREDLPPRPSPDRGSHV